MTSLSIKRINHDISLYEKSKDIHNKEGIYINFNIDEIFGPHQCIIIGSKNTPYENIFLPFEFRYPKGNVNGKDELPYPATPPKVEFCSLDSGCRIHPNLYERGKVCLSIINTWEGPKWTPCMNIITVFTAINACVLGLEHPIQGEPSFELESGELSRRYNDVVRHEGIRLYVCKILIQTPDKFIGFLPIMNEHFIKNYKFYTDVVMTGYKIRELKYPVYSRRTLINNYETMFHKINTYYNNLTGNNIEDINEKLETVIITKKKKHSSEEKQQSKSSRKAPNKPAKAFETGTIKTSENDGRDYIVKEYTHSNKSTTWKKWVLHK